MTTNETSQITLRKPTRSDGKHVHALIQECKPLDENSCYAYLLLCEHFAETCVVAESEGELVGFISGYVPPSKPDVIFVWQVAVKSTARGAGLGGGMLLELLLRDASKSARFLETTVSPSNEASARMFEKLADKLKVDCRREPLFGSSDFGEGDHEEEVLFRIGPLKTENA